MDQRERRLGENEILYREVNERVRELSDEFGLAEEPVDFVCECARLECAERIRMTVAEYDTFAPIRRSSRSCRDTIFPRSSTSSRSSTATS